MAEWRATTLGGLLERTKRPVTLDPDVEYRTLGVRWYAEGCFLKDPTPGRKIAAKTLWQVEAGDVVFSRLFAWKGSFGVVPDEHAGAVASNEFPTFTATDVLLPEFFALWSARPEVWLAAELDSTGTTANSRNRLGEEAFLAMEVELPPVDEQRTIVEIVHAATAVRSAAREERDAAFTALRSATEELLYTDEAWEELPDGWTLSTLGEVSDVRSGITKGRKARGDLAPRPFIRAANVQDGYLDLSEMKTLDISADEAERFALRDGDVLMIEGGNAEHLGRGWVWEDGIEDAVFQNHVFRGRPHTEHILPRFLAYAISATPARDFCLESAKKTTNLASINKTQISELPVPVPPLDLQRKIVAMLDALRGGGVAASHTADRANQLRSSLIEELVAGERRVVAL
jgi:type I restriction enzyme, S subunit